MNFEKYNANPKEWKHEGDCVVRAIATATKESWEVVYEDLCDIGKRKCRMPNSKQVYEDLLKRVGFIKYSMPKKDNGKRYTIREWVEEHPKFTGIISIANHLTYVENGTLIDTWDCSRKSIGNYWVDDTGYYEDKESKIVRKVRL